VKLRRGVHRRGHGNCPYQNPAIQLDHAVAHPIYALRRLVLLGLIRPGQTSLAQHRLTVTDDTLACNKCACRLSHRQSHFNYRPDLFLSPQRLQPTIFRVFHSGR